MTYAHEHLVIDGGRPVLLEPDFDLGDVDAMATEVATPRPNWACGRSSMPCPATRAAMPRSSPSSSRRTGVHVIAPTGLHHDRYYGPAHWSAPALGRGARRPVRRRHRRRHRRQRLRRPGRARGPPHPCRGHQGRRQRGRAVGARPARSSRRRPQAHSPDRRPDPDPLRGRDRRARAGPLPDRPRRRARAHRAQPRRQGRRPRLSPRAAGERRVRRVRPLVPLAATAERHAPAARAGWSRTGSTTRSCSGWMPRGAATTASTVARPGLTWLLDGFTALMAERGLDEAVRHRLFVDEPGAGVRLRAGRSRRMRVTDRLLTSVVGSHARPSWFVSGIDAAERGEFGPADLAEMLDDAVDLAIRDQEEAGIDIVCDGEMRRAGFFTAEFYRHLTGVRPLPPDAPARCRRPRPAASLRGPRADRGARRPGRRRRVPLRPDPDDPAAQGDAARPVHAVRPPDGPGRARSTRDRNAAAEAFVPILRAELEGARRGRRDVHPDRRSVAGHPSRRPVRLRGAVQRRRRTRSSGEVRLGAHLCFGNYLGRPLARRTYRPGPRRDAPRSTSTSSSSSSPTARWPRSRSSARSPPPGGTSPPASSTSRTTTSSRPTRSPSGSMPCSPPASRPSA